MRVAKSQRPNFSIAEIEELLTKWYGISSEIVELPSERDQNFHIRDYNYILKIANANEDEQLLDFQNKAMKKIAHINEISLHTNIQQKEMFYINNHLIRLLDYIPGKLLAKSTQTDALLRNLGEHVAKIDTELQNFTHPAMQRDFHWDLKNAERVITANLAVVENKEILTYFLEEFRKIELNAFRTSVIHNDVNDYNVIISNNRPKIIDFGDIVYSATIFDLAIAIAYVILDKDDPIHCAIQVLKGYHSILSLTEYEVDSLFVLIAMRLCVSVTLSAVQIKQEPDNEYLLISAAPAWKTLKKLHSLNARFISYLFKDAIGIQPDIFDKWQIASTPIQIIPGEYEIIDLSVGSIDLGLVQDFSDIPIKQKDKVVIGRYDETRLQYIHDAFKVKINDGYNWRATHMGVDFFAPEGTPIYAPRDGIVHSFANNAGKFNYGPTVILEHVQNEKRYYTLYGHLATIEQFTIGQKILQGEKLAEIGSYEINGNWTPHLHFQLILDMLGNNGTFPGVVEYRYRRIWKKICPNPNVLLSISNLEVEELPVEDIVDFRENHLGKSLSIAYSKPLKIVRGYMQYLFDNTGRQYLDAVNNIPHVGHSHPHVVAELVKQAQVLNTNTRYLHDNIVKYTERLLKYFPSPLEVCFFVNSGSEANELALRLARTYTQREDVIVLDCAYHGNTNLLTDISPYKFAGPGGSGQKSFVHTVSTPNIFRGKYKGDKAGELYAAEVGDIVNKIEVAAFICEALPGVGGQIILPEGYFQHAFRHVRAAGGVCISDEVQVGFGRLGKYFWGFEQQEVVPDIVVLGKPIGNGHPIAAVVTTRAIADAFNTGMEYFNSFGGNPVSCAVGLAVLDVIEQENLQDHAREVGQYLLSRIKPLQQKYNLVGDVRGLGLYIGIELVLDDNLTPAAEQAKYITDRMRDFGILISTDGPLHNVLKIKPPLQFTKENADFLVMSLDTILSEDAVAI